MRIGLFADSYTPQVSGVVTVLRTLKTELEKRGHTVFVFTVEHEDAVPDPTVIRVKSIQFPNEPQHRIGFFSYSEIIKKAKECRLDIIHTHTEFSLYIASRIVARKLKIPSIHTLHTYYLDYLYYVPLLEPFLKRNVHTMLKRVLRSQKCVVAPSRKIYNYLSEHGCTLPMKIVPNGIDLSAFHSGQPGQEKGEVEAFRARYGIKPEDSLIVFVGRLAVEKNISVLLDNFRKILDGKPDAKLLIVGDGPDRFSLEAYARELGVDKSVRFCGYLRWPDEVSTCYAASNLFMSASHSEVHPITFIEAMAAGLPVVCAADISVADMVLDGDNGYAVQNDHELWEKALMVLRDRDAAARMGKRSRELSEHYSVGRFVESMEKLYVQYAKHP